MLVSTYMSATNAWPMSKPRLCKKGEGRRGGDAQICGKDWFLEENMFAISFMISSGYGVFGYNYMYMIKFHHLILW